MNQALYIDRRIIPATRTDFLVPAAVTFPLSGASIDLWFEEDQYYDGGIVADATGDLSISRASTGYAQTVAGTLTNFGTNTLRITDKGLLVEDARTNLNIYSQDFSQSVYDQSNILTISTTTTAPDGTNTAQPLTPNTTNGNHFVGQRSPTSPITFTASSATFSIYAKANGYNFIVLEVINDGSFTKFFEGVFNLSNGTIESTGRAVTYTGSRAIEALGSGWYRCSITVNTTDANATGGAIIVVQNTNDPTITFAGDGTSGILAWGAQVEQASFASSYIPTTTTSATRAADLVPLTGNLQTVLAANQASIVVDVIANAIPTFYWRIIGQNDTAGNDLTYLCSDNASNTSVLIYDSVNGSNTILSTPIGNSLTFTGGVKVGSSWNTVTPIRSVVGGGGTVATDAHPRVTNFLTVGTGFAANTYWYGYMRRITAWNTRLVDATLQGFTYP